MRSTHFGRFATGDSGVESYAREGEKAVTLFSTSKVYFTLPILLSGMGSNLSHIFLTPLI